MIANPSQDFYAFLRQRGGKRRRRPANIERDNRIVELRQAGRSNTEIAGLLCLELNSLTTILSRLIREGRLERRRQNRFTRPRHDVPATCDETGSPTRTQDVQSLPAA